MTEALALMNMIEELDREDYKSVVDYVTFLNFRREKKQRVNSMDAFYEMEKMRKEFRKENGALPDLEKIRKEAIASKYGNID